jgi:hypothetical protein
VAGTLIALLLASDDPDMSAAGGNPVKLAKLPVEDALRATPLALQSCAASLRRDSQLAGQNIIIMIILLLSECPSAYIPGR